MDKYSSFKDYIDKNWQNEDGFKINEVFHSHAIIGDGKNKIKILASTLDECEMFKYMTIIINGDVEKIWETRPELDLCDLGLRIFCDRKEFNDCIFDLFILPNRIGKIKVIFEDKRLSRGHDFDPDRLGDTYIFDGATNEGNRDLVLFYIAKNELGKFNKEYEGTKYEIKIDNDIDDEDYYNEILRIAKKKNDSIYENLIKNLENYSLEFKYDVKEYEDGGSWDPYMEEVGCYQMPIFFIDEYNGIEVLNFGSVFRGSPT